MPAVFNRSRDDPRGGLDEHQSMSSRKPRAERPSPLAPGGWLFLASLSAATLVLATAQAPGATIGPWTWAGAAVLAAAAAFVQVFIVRAQQGHGFHTAIVFVIAAALLLPPSLLVLITIVQHLPEWLKQRYAWYIQTFNICNYALSALAAAAVSDLPPERYLGSEPSWALGAVFACLVFVAVNHGLLGAMLWLGRGVSPRDSGVLRAEGLAIDLVLASIGVGLVGFWHWNPWLLPLTLSPLVLMHRSLHLPRLEQEARLDPKTGLYNARHFGVLLADEVARAHRLKRPLALLMADLDRFRDLNNTHGHLAGDAVLAGVADIFRSELRRHDVRGRFGGEEFAIVLPGTSLDDALRIAERLRAAVAAELHHVDTAAAPLRTTLSIGVAIFPEHGGSPKELIHSADLAVYEAKAAGRDRVVAAAPPGAPDGPTAMQTHAPPRAGILPLQG